MIKLQHISLHKLMHLLLVIKHRFFLLHIDMIWLERLKIDFNSDSIKLFLILDFYLHSKMALVILIINYEIFEKYNLQKLFCWKVLSCYWQVQNFWYKQLMIHKKGKIQVMNIMDYIEYDSKFLIYQVLLQLHSN